MITPSIRCGESRIGLPGSARNYSYRKSDEEWAEEQALLEKGREQYGVRMGLRKLDEMIAFQNLLKDYINCMLFTDDDGNPIAIVTNVPDFDDDFDVWEKEAKRIGKMPGFPANDGCEGTGLTKEWVDAQACFKIDYKETTMQTKMIEVQAWTDGGCPVPGGVMAFAYLAKVNGVEKARKVKAVGGGTNNRAELSAVVMLLEDLRKASRVTIHTDSKNVIGWVYGWNTVTNTPDPDKRFKTNSPEVKANVAVIHRLIAERGHEVSFAWVKGHADSEENEIVDEMCTEAIKAAK